MSIRAYILCLLAAVPALMATAQRQQYSKEQIAANKAKQPKAVTSTAWMAEEPLGLREPVAVDTLEIDYYQRSVPSYISPVWACTGNLGTEGKNMVYMDQRPVGAFFFVDAFQPWIPALNPQIFYNTAIPMTQVSYNTGGGRDSAQDRLAMIFSGNINKQAQIGANLDYLYSKGSYEAQAAKHFNWGLSGSYIGDIIEVQASWNHYNALNKENGGITDDLYITDPAQLQGGISTIQSKSIPVNLKSAHTRVKGGVGFLNARYKIGHWKEEEVEGDSVPLRTFVPVMSVIYTLNYQDGKHRFDDTGAEAEKFFANTYLTTDGTNDNTSYWSLSNTAGVSMIEGFSKYAKFGLAAFATYETRKYHQTADTLAAATEESGLTPLPAGADRIKRTDTENLLWVGAQLTKQRGSILTYEATGKIGLVGSAAGEIRLDGKIQTRVPLLGDTVAVTGYGLFSNTTAPYLLNNYLSNHFIWHNDFGKERRVRFGGILDVPWTRTKINVQVENVQNMLYFDDGGLPAQHGGSIQVLSVNLDQRVKLGILHWDNRVVYQKSSNETVLSLPQVAVFSNLYIKCNIATLKLQLGVDCDYYTRYYAPAFQPATATFHNQHEIKLGNYPFMTAYANMKLGRTRFYVMFTHVNQGLFGGADYFSSPHYPLNPRRLQFGLSVDFID